MNDNIQKYTKISLISIVGVIWGLIYLPGLGRIELQGDENKRIEPALTMLHTGDYIIPKLADKQYLAKPPLEYWLIATSVYLTGDDSERVARLPSSILILLFVSILMLTRNSTIPTGGRFIASIVFMTTFGTITRGRECEIEALFTVLTGLSIWLWINWEDKLAKRDWKASLIIGGVLGLGLLAKGPLILLFFLLPVTIFLFREKRKKELISREYILMLLVAILIFACWALPVYLNVPVNNEHKVTATWSVQMFSRLNLASFRFSKWLKEISGAFLNFFPWIAFLPFILRKKSTTISSNSKWRACIYGTIAAFVLVNLMAGVRSRYTIPLISSFSILTGWAINSLNYDKLCFKILAKINVALSITLTVVTGVALILFPTGWIYKIVPILLNGQTSPVEKNTLLSLLFYFAIVAMTIMLTHIYLKQIPIKLKILAQSGILTGIAILSFFFIVAPILKPFDKKRKFGKSVTEFVPENSRLYSYCDMGEVGYHSFNYYIKRPVEYVYGENNLYNIPATSYVLIEANKFNHLLKNDCFKSKHPHILDIIKYKKKRRVLIKFMRI